MIADFAMLARMSGYKQPRAVCAWLANRRIKYLVGRDGKPSTTLDALNRALYGREADNEPNYSPPCASPKSTPKTAATTTSTPTAGAR